MPGRGDQGLSVVTLYTTSRWFNRGRHVCLLTIMSTNMEDYFEVTHVRLPFTQSATWLTNI